MSKKKNSQKPKQCTLYADGMHCPACEILIEKTILKDKSVKFADASLKDGKVTVNYTDTKPKLDNINENLASNGYEVSYKQFKKKNKNQFEIKDGAILINKERFNQLIPKFFIFIVTVLFFIFFINTPIGSNAAIEEGASIGVFFAFGLLAGASTCAALLGGLILSMATKWNRYFDTKDSMLKKFVPHALFYTWRIIGFGVIGLLLGIIGSIIADTIENLSIFISLGAGFVILLLGFNSLGINVIPNLNLNFQKNLGRFSSQTDSIGETRIMPIISGFFSFLIPCHLTVSAFTVAILSQNVAVSTVSLIAFAVGSSLSLAVISLVSIKMSLNPRLNANFNFAIAIFIILFGIYTIDNQIVKYNALEGANIPTISTVFAHSQATEASSEGNVQIIDMTVTGIDFLPANFEVEANKPVKFRIDGTNAGGCTSALIGKGIFPGRTEILGRKVEVEFTLSKGTHNFSCWMGMARGQIRAT